MPIRRRRYYYENVFGVDRFSLRTLRAMYVKLERDYTVFFRTLSDLYGQSKQKRDVDETLKDINKALGIVRSVIDSGEIAKKDAELLYDLFDRIEESKQFFLEQAASVKALQERLDRVTRDTGVSPQDLNITKDIVRTGIRQAQQSQREGTKSFLDRTAPGMMKLGGDLGTGVVTSLAGPFTPVLGALKDVVGGVVGIGRGMRERKFSAKARESAGRIRPSVPITQPADATTQQHATVPSVGPVATKGLTSSDLYKFFDRDAFRAKWTKAHLEAVKGGVGGKGDPGELGLGGLSSLVGKASDALRIFAPAAVAGSAALLGKGGLVLGAGWGAKKLYDLGKEMVKYESAQKQARKASDAYAHSVNMWAEFLSDPENLLKYQKQRGVSLEQIAEEDAVRRAKAEQMRLESLPWYKKVGIGVRETARSVGFLPPQLSPDQLADKYVKDFFRERGVGTTPEARELDKNTQAIKEMVEEFRRYRESRGGTPDRAVEPVESGAANGWQQQWGLVQDDAGVLDTHGDGGFNLP